MTGIDMSIPHSARIWNYWMDGKDNYPVDREAGDRFSAIYPGIIDMARSSRYFIMRVVRHLAAGGARQFLDVGMGLPSHDNTHEVAQRVAPDARVVYVDNDPLVLAHAHALLTGPDAGGTDYFDGDLNDPERLLAKARARLDFTRPVVLMLMNVLGHIPITEDDGRALSIVAALKDALPPGSHLALHDGTDTDRAHVQAWRLYNRGGSAPYHLRGPERLRRFLDGFQLLSPGFVPIPQWRPDPSPFRTAGLCAAWGGVARKPITATGGDPGKAVI
ncbi:SAM-dependent methyltransferase [Actinomadura litoris]|uniref:SAM-dependent methyltransferase n=1 Tax=Actinomadura litoris TaxID=2678616 RepID=A0A7K1KTI8_9ACTN|nr:SAM-dependent methyltransferase [Actinomadura litoris]MUN35317.1 SAM-dependent methyltransferase [Actinomadura litoris]